MLKCLWLKGYIRNQDEIEALLPSSGSGEKRSAEEVLEAAFSAGDYALLEKLNGSFAFVMHDEEQDLWLASRDRIGTKSVYYAIDSEGRPVFGNCVKDILDTGKIKKEFHEELLETYLGFSYVPGTETLFKGIKKIPAASYLLYKDKELKILPYWKPVIDPDHSVSEEEWAKKLAELFKELVRPFAAGKAAFLSSGVDSGLLTSLLRPEDTYTAVFDNAEFDEIKEARITAEQYGAKSVPCRIGPDSFMEAVPYAIRGLEHPTGDVSSVVLYLMAKAVSEKWNEVYSGETIDELFYGYYAHKRYLGAPKDKPREDRYTGSTHIMRDDRKQWLLKKYYGTRKDYMYMEEAYALADKGTAVDQAAMCDVLCYLEASIMPGVEKTARAVGIAINMPYSDNRLYDLALRIPSGLKLNQDTTKYIFRKGAEYYVGHENAFRAKRGFPVPVRIWMREESFFGRIREKFEGPIAEKFFVRENLLQLLEEYKYKEDVWRQIWCIYSFLVWYEEFF